MSRDILVVDDESDIRMLVAGILEDEGYAPRVAGDSDAALAAIEARPPPNLLILDIWLQGSALDGMDLLEIVRKRHPDLPVIMISGHGNIETAVTAIKNGAYDFIEKPFKADRLLLLVSRALEAAELRRENAELKLRMGATDEIIGTSSAMNTVRASVMRVAPTGSRVFITGAAGSGKEVVARMVHRHSRRAEGPFVVVNAAMMRPEAVELELFGAEAGGVEPGTPRKIGTFERAHGGTLFFDEVSDMPFETQGKIVRVLQDQTFERIGGAKRVEVDVRVIAATTGDLTEAIKAQKFREDLYYRLNVVPINVPSLMERREDIPTLAHYFMMRAAETSGLPPRSLAENALAILQSYDWPGNVRQLRNVMEWLLIMAQGDPSSPITAGMLPPELSTDAINVSRANSGDNVMALPLRDAREVFEREYLAAQIERFGGNISRTAQFVGMERSALHRKLRSLGLAERDRARDRGEAEASA